MEEQTGAAARNAPSDVWDALCGATFATSDREKLRSIMNLVGFGSSRDPDTGQRRAKRATAVMRFLDPQEWGTVDWRTISMMRYYERNARDMVKAVEEARTTRKGDIASLFDVINEDGAVETVEAYRSLRDPDSPRTVDVELGFYGASFLAWPRPS
ncbi:MAG: hypothetical protein JW846_09480 [Dehalococcoidia bacterium]|nr:hypothetical protein [Dehalococcoidia bacterium]